MRVLLPHPHLLQWRVLLFSVVLFCSCSNDGAFVPDSDPGTEVRVTSVTADKVSFSVSGNDYEAVAYLVLGGGDDIDFTDAEALFNAAAAVEEAGPFYLIDGLSPETEYSLYVAVRYYNGTYSGISVSDFRTSSPTKLFDVGIGYVNYAAIGLSNLIAKDTVNYKYYKCVLLPKADFANIHGVEELSEYFYDIYGEIEPYNAVEENRWWNNHNNSVIFYDIDVLGWYGHQSNGNIILFPDTDYVFAAWYTDKEGRPLSEVECTEIHTMPLPYKSPLEFDLHYEKGDDYIKVSSNYMLDSQDRHSILYFEPVLLGVYESGYFSGCKTDMEVANKVVQIYKNVWGDNDGEYGRFCTMYDGFTISLADLWIGKESYYPECKPDTEYVMCSFVYYSGKILSEPAIVRFTTPAE